MLTLRFHHLGNEKKMVSSVLFKIVPLKYEGHDGCRRPVRLTYHHTMRYCEKCSCYKRFPTHL